VAVQGQQEQELLEQQTQVAVEAVELLPVLAVVD
jgi:hypothetical protein